MENEVKKTIEMNALYDLYGSLLSKRQQKVMEMYYGENLSLSEIAENENITKTAVYDALKKSENALYQYEKELKFYHKNKRKEELIETLYKEGHLDKDGYQKLKEEN